MVPVCGLDERHAEVAPDTLCQRVPALPPTYCVAQEQGGSPAPASAESLSQATGAPMNTAQARAEQDQASKGYTQQIMSVPELLARGRANESIRP